MDDIEHSVLIAEWDWDCFCAESEECSVQLAKLAAQDDSGLSDTDDDRSSILVSTPPLQTSPDKLSEKDVQVIQGQKQSKTGDTRLNDSATTCESFDLDHNNANEDNKPTDQSYIEDLEGSDGSHSENKSSQSTIKPVSQVSLPHSQKVKDENSTDDPKTVTGVMDVSPVPKKEKERWFVTVNDSPVRLREKVGQKKRRKKKTSKKFSQHGGVISENCSSLNNITEPEVKIKQLKRQTMSKDEQLPIGSKDKSNTYPNSHGDTFSDLPNIQDVLHIQDVKYTSPNRSSEDESQKISSAKILENLNTTEIHEAKSERNSITSLKSKIDVGTNCECQFASDNFSHLNNDAVQGSPRFILGATMPTVPTAPTDTEAEQTEQQETFGLSYNEAESSSAKEMQCLESSSINSMTPDQTLGPTRPIYAISSFWDEMEKLTINDILQLRTANNRSQLSDSIIPEECRSFLQDMDQMDSKPNNIEDNGLLEDGADSDYFTHIDDSKPDRFSCEFSSFSDFDEEFIQLLNASANTSPEPYDVKEQTQSFQVSTREKGLQQDRDSKQTRSGDLSESEEIARLCPESELAFYEFPLYTSSEAETKMQDVILKTNQDNNVSTFVLDCHNIRKSTPSPVSSTSDILDDQCLLSLFEILKNDIESDQYWAMIPDKHTSIVSLPYTQTLSVPETYDNFFSDFEVGNFFFPSVQCTSEMEKKMVPIYSSSRSVVRDLALPEVEEMIQSDSEDECTPIHVMTRCSSQQASYTSPSAMPNLCFITNQKSTWKNLSLRGIKFSAMGRTWCQMATSWFFPKTKTADTAIKTNSRTRTSNSSIDQPMLHFENQALRQFTEKQIHVGTTVSGPERKRFLFSLKQADMCLVCIAFASWVLKSTNPQSSDMWKAALLANVSAISAIQYFRQYVKEPTEDEP